MALIRLRFLEEGAEECPLLLFSEATPEEAAALQRALAGAARGEVAVERLALVDAGAWTVLARPSSRDRGVRKTGPRSFLWEMNDEDWLAASELLEPFVDGSEGWQYLSQRGPIRVIFSPSGHW